MTKALLLLAFMGFTYLALYEVFSAVNDFVEREHRVNCEFYELC